MKSYLIRIWHVEVLANVAGNRAAPVHARTSYVVVPESWRELPVEAIWQRSEVMLDASYKLRGEELALIAFATEWVTDGAMPASPPLRDARVMANPGIAPQLIDRAVIEIDALRGLERPGVVAKAWQRAFAAWTVSPEGDKWYLLAAGDERQDEFEARLGGPAPEN
ncbi:hypothetical protein BH11MYX1_BH11MYX1_18610 [soil metagenome]